MAQATSTKSAWSKSESGLVLRALPVHAAMRNRTGDEGGPFGFGNQVPVRPLAAEPGTSRTIDALRSALKVWQEARLRGRFRGNGTEIGATDE
jgi:hypothetical protein